MQVCCPQCKTSLTLANTDSLGDVSCVTCGTAFSLLSDETLEFDGSTRRQEPRSETPESLAHFELLERLGMGAFGTVWRAHDKKLDRTVAIKIPRKDQLTTTETEHFFREARAAAQLKHRNIVSVHEVGRQGETVYIVSDFIEGLPLSQWLASRKMSANDAATMCGKVTEALHHAHQGGVIHRDIKPSNIIVDGEGEPHIMDFGLAKRETADVTMAVDGYAFGTPAYMSPEQARGEARQADRRTDIYSLGVMLFEMLTGELPFRGSPQIVVQQVLNDDPPHPRSLNRNVPEDLDTICWKCLEKLPQRRYATCQDLADELQRFLRGEPIEARPITIVGRAWRCCRRNPWNAGLATCFVLTLVAGLIGVTTQWLRADLNAERAGRAAIKAKLAAARERQAHRQTGHYLYVSNMNLAQQAYEMGDIGRVVEILERYRGPALGGEDPRGFEWYYWWRQCHRWVQRFAGHSAPIQSVDISSDERWIASASSDGEVKIWDTESGAEHLSIQGDDHAVYSVAFSPDARTLATGGQDTFIHLWDRESGRKLRSLAGHEGTIFALDFSHDGSTLASASSDTSVKLWDVADGTVTRTLDGHFDFVYAVALSDDGKRVASGGLDRTAIIWDAETGERLQTLEGHAIEVWSVDFSPDGRQLATGSGDMTIRTWDVQTGELRAIFDGHTDRVRSVAFSPDTNTLVSVGHDRSLKIWDLSATSGRLDVPRRNLNRRPVHFFERLAPSRSQLKASEAGHTAPLASVAFCTNGKTIVTGGDDLEVVAWDVAGLNENETIDAHEGSVNGVTYSRDGHLLASASNDRTVRLWDAHSGAAIGTPLRHRQRVLSVALSPNNRYAASGTFDKVVTLWDLRSGGSSFLAGHDRAIACVDFSSDGVLLASASHDATIKLWRVADHSEVATLEGHEDRVYRALFFDNDHSLATASADTTVRIWDVQSGVERLTLRGHSDPVWALALSSDGKLMASGGEDRFIKLWDPTQGALLRTIRGHIDVVQSLAFSPDGKTLASGSGDKTIRLWDVETGEPKTTLKGHNYRVWSLAFDPFGTTLASGSYKLRIWRAATDLKRSSIKAAEESGF